MKEIIIETFLDSIKLFPFLFVAYLLIEFLEHKSHGKTQKIITSSGKFGPIVGSVLGAFPQCGFSLLGSNLYVTRVITLGTLISIYLSTSDEMLPLLIVSGSPISLILKILGIKILIGIVFGFIIDAIFNKKEKNEIQHFCNEEHCECEKSILLSSLKHSLKVFIFIIIVSLLFNVLFEFIDIKSIEKIFEHSKLLSPIIGSIIGLIPSCAASVIITELFLNGLISFGTLIAGLCSSAGVALLVLFKINKNIKENLKILGLLVIISFISGLIIDMLGFIF